MKAMIAAMLAMTACVATQDALPSQTVNRATLRVIADGVRLDGAGVLQRKSRTRLQFDLPRDTKELAITTCHREVFIQNPPQTFTYDYIPAMWLENWDTCLLRATAFLSDGCVKMALIDWTSNETLPGILSCNGTTIKADKGASLCQSRAGLVQRIAFSSAVSAKAPDRCNQPYNTRSSDMAWEWFVDLTPGLCIYAFKDQDGKLHRLTTYGYTTEGIE